MAEKKLVLITGAAGTYGRILRTEWGDRYNLRLADMNPVDVPTASATKSLDGQAKWSIGTNGFVVNDGAAMPLRTHETTVHLETGDFDAFLAACDGVDTVVHLAADPRPNGNFHTSLLPSNVVGVYNAFEAARQAGCKRLLFASSVHAMLGYHIDWSAGGTGEATDNMKPPNPTNTYGATKAWGEALCHKYSNTDGLSCIALRFTSPREHTQAIIARNVAKCIDAGPEVKHTLLNWVELEDESTTVTDDGAAARL